MRQLRPTSPEELHVALDPDGRPYDGSDPIEEVDSFDLRLVDVFHFEAGQVLVMDGNAIAVDPTYFADSAVTVDFGENENLLVSIIWFQRQSTPEPYESVAGVRIDVASAMVENWDRFEFAYGTDGASGGVTSQAVIDRWDETDRPSHLVYSDMEDGYEVADFDGVPGPDTLVFVNSLGDGGFPMSRGYDADGELASLVIWDTQFAWRQAVLDGSPPPDVTEREDEILACIEGRGFVIEGISSWFCLGDEP